MSTAFKPIEIPPGVVATATKKMRSSNWSEVNFIRWRENQLTPMGGQAQMSNVVGGVDKYKFASRCKLIHGWYDLAGVYRIAYLCESNLYVDTGGTLVEISPMGGIAAPAGLVGGYGDGLYNVDLYGTLRSIPGSVSISKIPDAYSLDNFGSILYAMTSADSRLLTWDPGVGPAGLGPATIAATAAFTTTSPNIAAAANPGWVTPGMSVYDVTNSQPLGVVLTYTGTALVLTANVLHASAGAADVLQFSNVATEEGVPAVQGNVTATKAFTTATKSLFAVPNPGWATPGMSVYDITTNQAIGTVQSYGPALGAIPAATTFTTSVSSFAMAAANPGWILPGMDVYDLTTAKDLGLVSSYANVTGASAALAAFTAAATKIPMNVRNPGWILPGMTVFDNTANKAIGTVLTFPASGLALNNNATAAWTTASTTITMAGTPPVGVVAGMNVRDSTAGSAFIGTVSTYTGTTLTLTAAAKRASSGAADLLIFDDTILTLTAPAGIASSGTTDSLQFTGDVLTLQGSALAASAGAADVLQFSQSDVLTLTSNALAASAGAGDVLQIGNWNATHAPRGRCFVVTQERFLMIFGMVDVVTGGSARRFGWCDQENPSSWNFSDVTSQAGFLDIEPSSPIICAIASRVGVLFWTGKHVYASRFIGIPYVYNYVELADGTTPWSPQSMTTTSALTLWMSEQGVFSYDGTSVLPVQCMIRPWVDDDIDTIAVRELAFACHLGEYNEWWWFFPTLNAPYNTRAIVYNYKEGWWTQANLSRSAGITSSYTSHPIFADDFVAFQHEVGNTYQNAVANLPVVLPFAETFDLNLVNGQQLTTVKQLIPDVEAVDATDPQAIIDIISNLRYSLFYRNSRSLGTAELQSPRVPVRQDGYVDLRTTGRDVRLRIDVASAVVEPFTLGQHLIDSVVRGDR